jgi:glycosyltransferase involved in cell wall biosynthesis
MPSTACIVIPTLNAGLYLGECLESISSTRHHQSEQQLSILILDGGSNDCTHEIVKYYQTSMPIDLRVSPGSHPAQRVNNLIESREYDYLLICHADDIYNIRLRLNCLNEAIARNDLIRGSQVGFFESPLNHIEKPQTPIYAGCHLTHPLQPENIILEMCHWWCISLNTACINAKGLADLGLRYEWENYKYCADYMLNWKVAKTGRISNSPVVTTITRHNKRGDGPLNQSFVALDYLNIREAILEDLRLREILGDLLFDKYQSLCYSYGAFSDDGQITKSDCIEIKDKLDRIILPFGEVDVQLGRLPLPQPSLRSTFPVHLRDKVKNKIRQLLGGMARKPFNFS